MTLPGVYPNTPYRPAPPESEYIHLPLGILYHPSLSVGAKTAYMFLVDLVTDKGWGYTTTAELAADLQCCELTANGYLRELRAARALRRHRKGQGRPTLYILWGKGPGPETRPLRRRKKRRIDASLRWQVWERDNFTCQACGSRRHLSVDHMIPESRGGTDDLANLRTLCSPCNSKKGAR